MFVADNVDQLVERPFSVPRNGKADILRDIERRPVSTQEHLFVKPDRCKINPHGIVFIFIKHTAFQAFQNFGAPFAVHLAFKKELIE